MTDTIVKLSRRYEAHGKVFDAVTVREPLWSVILKLGEPYEVQRAAGSNVIIENTSTVAAYVNHCIVEPGAECCGELGVKDTRAVRDAVLDFFRPGEPPADPSAKTSESVATN